MKNKNPIELNRDEYLFLTDKFEFMTPEETESLPCYIVSARKDNFKKIIELAIVQELNETEQKYINDRFFLLMNPSQIAEKYNVSRQSVYRCLEKASATLFSSLKYVYCCGFTLLNPPKNLEEIFSTLTRRNSF